MKILAILVKALVLAGALKQLDALQRLGWHTAPGDDVGRGGGHSVHWRAEAWLPMLAAMMKAADNVDATLDRCFLPSAPCRGAFFATA